MPGSDARPAALRLTHLIADAWPAAETLALGEWRLRWAWGVTRRANSVIATGHPDRALDTAVDAAEAFYAGRGLATRFQLSKGAVLAELRPLLEERGYAEDARTDVMTAPLAGVAAREGAGWVTEEASAPGNPWWSIYSAVEHGSVQPAEGADIESALRGTLLRPSAPTIFVTASRDGVPAAAGQGVAQGEWLGLQCVATLPEFRRLGGARAVMASLARWGERRGCRFVYLAVLRSNAAARRLYRQRGFSPVGSYAYLCCP
jgi:ribosomal protein S18 acetylase RimI-like enzyme